MKKLFVILLFCYLVFLIFGAITPVLAEEKPAQPAQPAQPATGEQGKTLPKTDGAGTTKPTDEKASTSTGNYGLSAVEGTPKGLLYEVFIKIATFIMGIVGIVLVAMIIYGGVLYMTSAGNEKQTETAKRVITYAIIGVIIIFASYVIAKFVIGAVG